MGFGWWDASLCKAPALKQAAIDLAFGFRSCMTSYGDLAIYVWHCCSFWKRQPPRKQDMLGTGENNSCLKVFSVDRVCKNNQSNNCNITCIPLSHRSIVWKYNLKKSKSSKPIQFCLPSQLAIPRGAGQASPRR